MYAWFPCVWIGEFGYGLLETLTFLCRLAFRRAMRTFFLAGTTMEEAYLGLSMSSTPTVI